MKKRTRNKLLMIASAILLAAVTVLPGIGVLKTNAEGKNYEDFSATQLRPDGSSETTEIQKFLQIENGHIIPAAIFSFTIGAGDAVSPTTTTLPVYAGISPDAIIFSEKDKTPQTASPYRIEFEEQQRPADGTGTNGVTVQSNVPDTDHYTASKTMVLDFSQVRFPEPGIYRHIITETNSTNNSVSIDAKRRILDVYVADDESTAGKKYLKIIDYVLYVENSTDDIKTLAPTTASVTGSEVTYEDNTKETTTGSIVDDANVKKSKGFVNKYPTTGLTFGKEVTGNQGSKDKYFKYTLSITGPVGTVLSVDRSQANESISANPNKATTCIGAGGVVNPSVLTLAADPNDAAKGIVEANFYLQDGQYISISGFTAGMTYTLEEDKEDYNQAAYIEENVSSHEHDNSNSVCDELKDGTVDSTDANNIKITGTFATGADGSVVPQYTGFTNSKDGVIPTGVVLSAVPWVIAGVVILAGIVFFAIRSKRKYEEE